MLSTSSRLSWASRPTRYLPALALIAAIAAGCTAAKGPNVGAPTATLSGPTVVGTNTIPPLVDRVTTSSSDAPPTVEAAVVGLSGRIDQALAHDGDPTPATRLSRKKAAGDQMMVKWVLGQQWPDPHARERVRIDAVTILHLIQQSGIRYGSVLLLATGASLVKGKKKISIVVRAKYTKNLVRSTDWAHVSPSKVLGMCDDKPAVIAVGYR